MVGSLQCSARSALVHRVNRAAPGPGVKRSPLLAHAGSGGVHIGSASPAGTGRKVSRTGRVEGRARVIHSPGTVNRMNHVTGGKKKPLRATRRG